MLRNRVLVLALLFPLLACGESGDDAGSGDGDPGGGTRRVEVLKQFTIELPEGWKRSNAPGTTGFHFVSPDGDETADFQENIGFVRADVPEDGDPGR